MKEPCEKTVVVALHAENVIEWREQTVTSRHVKGLVFRLVPKIKLRYYVSNQMCIVLLKNAKIVILKQIALIVLGKLVVVGIIFIKDNH